MVQHFGQKLSFTPNAFGSKVPRRAGSSTGLVLSDLPNNPHALRAQQIMKIRLCLVLIFSSIFWKAKRHHYWTLDVGRSMLDVHFHIN